jgi:hypothetical protein
MPNRGSDADSRIFFDQLVSLAASRLKATGAIRLEDRQGIIAFGDKQKLVGVAHTVFENGGAWSYFICPRCGGRKKKLWLVDNAPRCLSCCWSLGVRYRSAYGFGRAERLSERDRYVDRVQDRRLRGRKRRLTMTMRRSMITCRLAQLAHQQKAKDGSDEPLPFMRAYQPRKAAIEAIPDLKRLWKARTAETLEQALDQAQTAILNALQSDDMRVRIIAASLMLRTRAARQCGWTRSIHSLALGCWGPLLLTFYGSKAGATFCLAMISISSGLKLRASQRCRNNCLTLEMENGAPADFLGEPRPPTVRCPGRGGMASDLTALN